MFKHSLFTSIALISLTACDLAPEWKLPEMSMPEIFKEAPPETTAATTATETPTTIDTAQLGAWKTIDPTSQLEETQWWRMFNDETLNGLMTQAMAANPSLEVALQRLASARATAGISDAALYPTVDIGAGPQRQQAASANINANLPPGTNVRTKPFTTYTVQGSIAYEMDLFGKLRNSAKAAQQDAAAQAALYRAARLTLQADIAQAYFTQASLLREETLLAQAVATRKESLKLVRAKRDAGAADDLAVSTAESELATTQSEYAALGQERATNEHRLATLVGTTPSQFKVTAKALTTLPPAIPAGLPSTLLTRRPDVAATLNQIAAANARIGAAKAGYFPDFAISLGGGYSSTELNDVFQKNSQFWSIGPIGGALGVITQPLFHGGELDATLAKRDADYLAASATYKDTALNAFREVEDSLSGLRSLRTQGAARDAALKAANRSLDIAQARAKAGYSSHIELLEAERGQLAAARANAQTIGQYYVTTVQLVRALGGSW